MSYRRRHDRRERVESPFVRNALYEVPKEGLGKLLDRLSEWGGAALGLAAASAAAKHGLPVSPTFVSGAGMVLGAVVGAVSQAAVVAALDTLKEYRGKRRGSQQKIRGAGPGSRESGQRQQRAPRRGFRAALHRPRAGQGGGGGATASTGEVIAGVERVLAELDRVYGELTGLVERMQSTHGWVMMMLAGGRPEVLQHVNARMSGARAAITDTCTLIRLTRDDLRGYLRSI